MQSGVPLLTQRPESTGRLLMDNECRVCECGNFRMWHSFFCGKHALAQRPVSVALMVGGLVVSATGEILGQGRLHSNQ
ncbi:hypothetical protein LCGC14_0693690 [marine sediment metagenome]|uniref:Uncharacterized protein n=1 Tax=marine sediment metagenome TaxID=412755 RepID=A0A0F9TSN2_9ZZZZ